MAWKHLKFLRDPESYGALSYWPPEEEPTWRPLLLYLHGAGEVGEDINMLLNEGATGTPLQVLEAETAIGDLMEFVVVAPQTRQSWKPATLAKFMEFVYICFPNVDRRHLYISGHSMGATAALKAAVNLGIFAAVVPVAPAGAPKAEDLAKAKLPVWAFHGKNDVTVPSDISDNLIQGLRHLYKNPDDAKLTLYDDAPTPPGYPQCKGHASTIPTYSNPSLYSWLLTKKHGINEKLSDFEIQLQRRNRHPLPPLSEDNNNNNHEEAQENNIK